MDIFFGSDDFLAFARQAAGEISANIIPAKISVIILFFNVLFLIKYILAICIAVC